MKEDKKNNGRKGREIYINRERKRKSFVMPQNALLSLYQLGNLLVYNPQARFRHVYSTALV